MTERRAPVNGAPRGTISWEEHEIAWRAYHRSHSEQSAETIANRGGFGIEELTSQLGHLPKTWRPSEGTRFMPGVVASPARADVAGELLTDDEHRAVALAGQLATLLHEIIGTGPHAAADWSQFANAIHVIQHAVMKQAAARAYPDRYRLLGQDLTP